MTTLIATPATITELYAARAAGETTAAMLTDGRHILDISRNDDGSFHLWTNLGEVSNVTGERMVIAPPAQVLTITKEIKYNRLTKDYDMLLNGEYVGSAACYHSAEVELDHLAYEQLDRAGVEPELALSATEPDGGSDPDEIAAEYAEALPTCAACHTNDHAPSGLQSAFCTECVYAMLQGRKNRLDSGAPDDQPPTTNHRRPTTDDHDIILPDPAECPDVRAPRSVEDLPACDGLSVEPCDKPATHSACVGMVVLNLCDACLAIWQKQVNEAEAEYYTAMRSGSVTACERYSTPPSLALWGPDTPECPTCHTRHDPVVICPVGCANCDKPHHIQRCPEVWRALTG